MMIEENIMNPLIHEWKKMDGKKNEYFFKNIMPLYVKSFVKESATEKEYEVLISLVGLSPATSVLSTIAVKPKKLYLIGTAKSISENSEMITENIEKFWTKIPTETIKINDQDITDMYQKLYEKTQESNNVIIDITGGKKSMSAIAGIVSSIFNIDSCYIDYNKYLDGERTAYFSSEYIRVLENPYYFSGDKLLKDAVTHFNTQEYLSTINCIKEYLNKAMIKKQFNVNVLEKISLGYENWLSFKFTEALNDFLCIIDYPLNQEIKTKLKNHIDLLRKIINDDIYKVFNHYAAAYNYIDKERFEVGVFILYRTIEMMLQYRLREKYKFNSSKPNYDLLKITFPDYKAIAENTYGEEYFGTGLPNKTALMDNYFLLNILKDELIKSISPNVILNASKIRNGSNMAHGDMIIDKKSVKQIEEAANIILKNFIDLYKKEKNISEIKREFKPITITEKQII